VAGKGDRDYVGHQWAHGRTNWAHTCQMSGSLLTVHSFDRLAVEEWCSCYWGRMGEAGRAVVLVRKRTEQGMGGKTTKAYLATLQFVTGFGWVRVWSFSYSGFLPHTPTNQFSGPLALRESKRFAILKHCEKGPALPSSLQTLDRAGPVFPETELQEDGAESLLCPQALQFALAPETALWSLLLPSHTLSGWEGTLHHSKHHQLVRLTHMLEHVVF
jgi:hypothetical protein